MNTFNLIVAGVIALAVLYIGTSQFTSILSPGADISGYAQTLLLEAQSDLGHAKGATLSLKAGQTLYARNLDSSTRTVAFACATPSCCPTLNACNQSLSASGDRIRVNQDTKTSLTARCLSTAGIHTCKVYVGNAPAQVELSPTTIPPSLEINGQREWPVDVTLQNTGKTDIGTIALAVDLVENQSPSMSGDPLIIDHDETTLPALAAGKSAHANVTLLLQRVGTFTLRLTAQGEDAGMDVKEYPLTITGTEASLCEPDTMYDEAAVFDSFSNVCRKKVACTACDFAFQCRDAWKSQYPLNAPQYYDENRGEKGFAYVLYPADLAGNC